jgi:hypothetical protein
LSGRYEPMQNAERIVEASMRLAIACSAAADDLTEIAIRGSERKKRSHQQIERDGRVAGLHFRHTRLAGLYRFGQLSLR